MRQGTLKKKLCEQKTALGTQVHFEWESRKIGFDSFIEFDLEHPEVVIVSELRSKETINGKYLSYLILKFIYLIIKAI